MSLYRALMYLGGWWCHQLPARSPHLFGWQMPLCWRCTGVLFGALALFLWALQTKRLPALTFCLLLALPLPLDVLHASLTHGDGDNARRLVTGLLFGFYGTAAALQIFVLLLKRRRGRPVLET